jgi:hypothetical protein
MRLCVVEVVMLSTNEEWRMTSDVNVVLIVCFSVCVGFSLSV